jgi:hypothetical protein
VVSIFMFIKGLVKKRGDMGKKKEAVDHAVEVLNNISNDLTIAHMETAIVGPCKVHKGSLEKWALVVRPMKEPEKKLVFCTWCQHTLATFLVRLYYRYLDGRTKPEDVRIITSPLLKEDEAHGG